MVNFVSGFIPHYATAMYPLYHLLKKSEKTFALSEEGRLAIQEIKKILIQETMTYKIYEKTPEGEKQMFDDLGYVPEKNMADFLLPGVSPGRNTPQVTDFLQN